MIENRMRKNQKVFGSQKKKPVAKDCEIAFLTLHFALCISFSKVWFHVQIGNYAEHARRGIT